MAAVLAVVGTTTSLGDCSENSQRIWLGGPSGCNVAFSGSFGIDHAPSWTADCSVRARPQTVGIGGVQAEPPIWHRQAKVAVSTSTSGNTGWDFLSSKATWSGELTARAFAENQNYFFAPTPLGSRNARVRARTAQPLSAANPGLNTLNFECGHSFLTDVRSANPAKSFTCPLPDEDPAVYNKPVRKSWQESSFFASDRVVEDDRVLGDKLDVQVADGLLVLANVGGGPLTGTPERYTDQYFGVRSAGATARANRSFELQARPGVANPGDLVINRNVSVLLGRSASGTLDFGDFPAPYYEEAAEGSIDCFVSLRVRAVRANGTVAFASTQTGRLRTGVPENPSTPQIEFVAGEASGVFANAFASSPGAFLSWSTGGSAFPPSVLCADVTENLANISITIPESALLGGGVTVILEDDVIIAPPECARSDLNQDGVVNWLDRYAFASSFNSTPTSPTWNFLADFTGDNVVDTNDLILFDGCWQQLASCLAKGDTGGQGGVAIPDGQVNNNDFVVFLDNFFAISPAADIGGQGGISGADGLLDNNDFAAFLNWFFGTC